MPGMKKHDILGHEFMGIGEPWGCAQPARPGLTMRLPLPAGRGLDLALSP